MILSAIKQIEICVEKLNAFKIELQVKLDAKKTPKPPPLPPPLPVNILQPEEKRLNIKTIEGSVLNARSFLQPVAITEKRTPTLFDIEIAATVK